MPKAERNAGVNSDGVRSNYSANEQSILRDFSSVLSAKK
jgi:hypothetical protein